MSERQAGLYWVKAYEDGIWEGLHWHGKWWAGCSIGYEPPVVGPRIPTPDEPWQTVPVDPTDDMVHAGCEATGDCERLGECHMDCHCSPAPKVYHAMLAAAPRPGGE